MIEYLAHQKSNNNILQKRDVAYSVQPFLPFEILNKPKTGFETPIKRWGEKLNQMHNKSSGLSNWQQNVFDFHSNSLS